MLRPVMRRESRKPHPMMAASTSEASGGRRAAARGFLTVPHERAFCPCMCYLPGLKPSFRLTARLNTRAPGLESLLSTQK